MVLALSTNANATAQKHRHTPRTEQVSDTVKHNQDAIEAYSDTTATNNANADDNDVNLTSEIITTIEECDIPDFKPDSRAKRRIGFAS